MSGDIVTGALTIEGQREQVGYQQITDLSSAVGFTAPKGAKLAVITPEAQAVRWRDDGTDPTTAVGMPLAVGAYWLYTGRMELFKAIEITSGAILNISYYK